MNITLKKYVPLFAVLITLSVLVLLYFFVSPVYGRYFPKCIFYSTTGLHCPGCGSQRAIAALLHGDVLLAIHNNLLAIAMLPFLLYSLVALLINTFSEKKIQQKIFYSPLFVKTILVAVIVFTVLRNIPYYPFNLLAPVL